MTGSIPHSGVKSIWSEEKSTPLIGEDILPSDETTLVKSGEANEFARSGTGIQLVSATLMVQQRKTRLWRLGSGLKLVLLHGEFGDAATYWQAVAPALASQVELICPDLPGFGDSEPLATPRLQSHLFWLRDLLGQVAAEPIVVGGSGYGAVVARFFASRYPEQVRHLILSGGGDIDRQSPVQRWLDRLAGKSRRDVDPGKSRTLGRLFYSPRDYCTPDFVRRAERERIAALQALRSLETDPLPTAWTPSCPTLLIWGNDDRYCSLARQRALANEMKDPRTVEIFEAGHLVAIEQPKRFSAHVLDFLQRLLQTR